MSAIEHLKNIKITPKWVISGTVATCDICTILWGFGLFDKSRSSGDTTVINRIQILSKSPRVRPEVTKELKAHRQHISDRFLDLRGRLKSIKADWREFTEPTSYQPPKINKTDFPYVANDFYGDISTKCLRTSFPGAKLHGERGFKIDPTKRPFRNDTGIAPPRANGGGPVTGCATMVLHREKHYFLLSSEIALKRGNIGLVLWTGAKNASMDPFKTKTTEIHIRHFMAFLQRDEGSHTWTTLGGFSWGGRVRKIGVNSLKIQSPRGEHITEWFDSKRRGPQNKRHRSYYGVWVEDSREKEQPIKLYRNWYSSGRDLNLSFTEVRGYTQVNTFLLPPDEIPHDPLPWKQYCVRDREYCWDWRDMSVLKTTEIIDLWYSQFKSSKGSWESMEEEEQLF